MGYCFMRIEKVKDKGSLNVKYNHNYRKEMILNVDSSRTKNNVELVPLKEGQTYVDAWNDKINSLEYYKEGHKIRSTQVLAFEILTTLSKEDADRVDLEQWKKDNLEWMRETFDKNADKYGSNILSMVSHEDESCIHIHTIVVPINERGRLSAYDYTGGKQKMRALQDTYAEKMKVHGLKRGIKGSRAPHQDLKRFYSSLNEKFEEKLPEPEKYETVHEYKERVQENYYTPLVLKSFAQERKIERLQIEKDSLENQYNIKNWEYERECERKFKEEFDKKAERLKKMLKNKNVDEVIDKADKWDAIDTLLQQMKNDEIKEGFERKIKEIVEKERSVNEHTLKESDMSKKLHADR